MLECKEFDKDFFIIECDKNKYYDFFEPLECKICNNGFLISKNKRIQIDKIINYISNIEHNKYKNYDPKTYYKSFTSHPADFKKMMNNEDEKDDDDDDDDDKDYYSSSAHQTSSTDNFPSPSTPRRKYTTHEIEEIFEILKDLQKRIRILEQKK